MSESTTPPYAELHALSAFSFQRSAARPELLVQQAAARGYSALAITDECSMAGIVRAHEAARDCDLKLIIGSEFRLDDGSRLVLLATSRCAYAQICRLITRARRRALKGEYQLEAIDLDTGLDEVLAIWKPARQEPAHPDQNLAIRLKRLFEGRLWLGATRLLVPGEREWFDWLDALGRRLVIPRLACGDVRLIRREDKPLLDVMCALRLGRPVADCGLALAANGERHVRERAVLARLYPAEWLAETLQVAERCDFSLAELDYHYPRELVPEPLKPIQHLRQLTLNGARQRYGRQLPDRVRALLARELTLIEELGMEAFFLTVHDLVTFARSRGILCQGRGSAANSAVCYCLGVTEVDPAQHELLFERFLSKERNEPPDIDIDFEHERREEVLQYLYRKYGRERAALAATVICYRPRSALQDVGRALGLAPERIRRLSASLAWWDRPETWPERLRECGLDPEAALVKRFLDLSSRLIGLPRHLSQHVGGMVISDRPLHELVPIENAAMADRSIIQWDKDDLETLGLLKVDCLALGMLTVIRKAIDLINRHPAPNAEPGGLSLATIPREDTKTYDMLCRGDAVGVFQVESRAQMAMLSRLRPRCFYDLVIEVAIVRPGPIQGDMVHPYLERRRHPERVSYPSPELKTVLQRTLGVPIFQEQVMRIAMVAAGFSPGEADQLRRAMAAWRRRGNLDTFRERLISGMRERGYPESFAERIHSQIRGFAEYGFPESHAASFALLSYVSAWLKCHHPAAFACALINSQPMGFYAPAQIINDARRHGVQVLPPDIRFSRWDATLVTARAAKGAGQQLAVRLGFRLLKGLHREAAERIVQARLERPFQAVDDLVERTFLDRRNLETLVNAGALKSLAGHRHRARWAALGAPRQGDLLAGTEIRESAVQLSVPDARSELLDDYASLGLSLAQHPLRLLRGRLGRQALRASDLPKRGDGLPITAAGLVTHRQRPATASGVVFLSLEDETGIINVVVWPKLAERHRREVLSGQILRVHGKLQNTEGVCHLIAKRIDCLDSWLAGLASRSRDFC